MTPEQESLLKQYAEEVVNCPLHLTADRDVDRFWSRHVQDAVKILELVPAEYSTLSTRVIDVGSGNGIPGIPIAILNPGWNVDLLDSDNKKCGFLDMICKKYAIKNCHIHVGRAEVIGKESVRQSYDIAFSRAISKLPTALELAGSFVKVGGFLIVPHGTSWNEELKESAEAMTILGLSLSKSIEYVIDGVKFHALSFSKISDTPKQYPRNTGIPTKRPL
jgi:16S rRNA (guanine527-N7)-methyltransferase